MMLPSVHKVTPTAEGTLIGVYFIAPLGWYSIPQFHDAVTGELWNALPMELT